jgi:hypothetical protein
MTSRTLGYRHLFLALGLFIVSLRAEAWNLDCAHSAERRARVDTAGATSVLVNARAGDLSIRPTTGTGLEAHGKACASSDKLLRQTDVRVQRNGTVIEVDVSVPDAMVGIGIFYSRLDLTVDVPAGLPVEVNDSSGDIEAHGIRLAKVTDSSGDITLRNLKGDVEIWDSSGDVRVDDVAGRVLVRDSSGDILISGAADVVIPSDSSGDITVRRVTGSVRIEQDSSGDIRIADVGHDFTLLGDSSGEVNVERVKGKVQLP